MTFVTPELLILLVLPAVWLNFEWRRTERRVALLGKATLFMLVLLALAQPQLHIVERRIAAMVLADTSASVPVSQIEQQRRFIDKAMAARGRHELRVFSFDDAFRTGPPREARFENTGTNLEAALAVAMAAQPPARLLRLVLLSDGHENQGAIERALYQARERNIPVDVVALAGRTRPDLHLLAVNMPSRVFSGEEFLIEIVIESPRPEVAKVDLTVENTAIGGSRAQLTEGQNVIHVRTRLQTSGTALVHGKISLSAEEALDFQRTLMVETARVLLISNDPPEAGGHLQQVLSASGFALELSTGLPPTDLDQYQVILANNQNLEQWSPATKRRLEEFVRQGGGFLLIAGENNLYADPAEVPGTDMNDLLHQMLPANLAPPRKPEGTAVVLVLDKSSSMEGKKMELALQSAIGVVQNLALEDQVGVLVFDNSFVWVEQPRINEDPQSTIQRIRGIAADGGTQIAPALEEAFHEIRRTEAVYKHILLLTDGISEVGNSLELAREAGQGKITISTIGLGQDVNRAYLEHIAAAADGQSYFLINVEGLEQIMLRDVREHTGSSVTERSVMAEVAQAAEILEDVPISEAGSLLGWVKFIAKPEADILLTLGDEPKDPLLTRWQYGLGRSAVFASDAKNRWAVEWVQWPGFGRFWSNVVRDLLPRTFGTEVETRYVAAARPNCCRLPAFTRAAVRCAECASRGVYFWTRRDAEHSDA